MHLDRPDLEAGYVQKLSDSFEFGFRLLIITARKRYISGKDLRRRRAGRCKTPKNAIRYSFG